MSNATVRIPTPLRAFTGGQAEVAVRGATVGAALQDLGRRHADVLRWVLDDDGRVREFVNVYVGERNVRVLGGLAAALGERAVISIVPAVAGGRR